MAISGSERESDNSAREQIEKVASENLTHIAKSIDKEKIVNLYLNSFPEEENQLVANLAFDLLTKTTTPETLVLITNMNDEVIGHIAFSPIGFSPETKWTGYILAPLAIHPDYQKQGMGSHLVRTGIDQLAGKGVDVVLVYGDPGFYSRFGFSAETATTFLPPYELQYPFGWQAKFLNKPIRPEESFRISCVEALRNSVLW